MTVSALATLPAGLRAMHPDEGLPPLPEFGILLLKGRTAQQPMTDALAAHIEESFRRHDPVAPTTTGFDAVA